MMVNEDPEFARRGRRIHALEQELARTIEALERGCSVTPRERGQVVERARTTLNGKRVPKPPAGAYC